MKRLAIVCLILGVVGCGQPHVTIEFRLAETQPGDGLTEVSLPRSGETFYLYPDVAISNADIASASVIQGSGGPSVELIFTPSGSEKLARLTEANLKKRVAMLVDGGLVSAPVINAPIPGGRAIMVGDFSEDQALRIAQGLRAHAAER
jgi:preprotein translocase subunit SecD